MALPNGRVLYRVRMKNGEYENVVLRYKIPGKNRGFLGIAESGNCYTLFRDMAWWVFDLADYPGTDPHDRDAVMEAYKKGSDERSVEGLADYFRYRMGGGE